MQLFRITRAARADLQGTGGIHAAGRWHTRGRRIVYAATTRALCILEVLVHVDPEDVPDDLVLLTIDVPDELEAEVVEEPSLPAGWNAPQRYDVCRAVGDAWLDSLRTAVLRVPSAVAPDEWNVLINPAHPSATRITITHQRPFSFDPRLVNPPHR